MEIRSVIAKSDEVLWIHAASGEIEYAKPLLREMKALYPERKFLLTYSSVSARDFLGSALEADVISPLPFEAPGNYKKLFEMFQPRILAFSRTDVWPFLLIEAKKRKVETLLFAATVSKKLEGFSSRKNLYQHLNHISFVSQRDLENFNSETPSQSVDGDPRADQVLWRMQNKKTILPLRQFLGKAPLIVFGSMWMEDLEALEEFFADLNFHFILVPHEWNEEIEMKLRGFLKGRLWKKYSELKNAPTTFSLLEGVVVDQKGILAELYELGDAAFVGGSFKFKVHSVFEPLAFHKRVFVGPLHKNNREAVEFSALNFSEKPLVCEVSCGRDLIREMKDVQHRAGIESMIAGEMKLRAGATQKILQRLK